MHNPNTDELAFDRGLTARPTNLHARLAPMADILGGVIDDVHSGDLSAVEALDLHNQASLVLSDLFGRLTDACVPDDFPSHHERFEEAMNT